jgi:uncharacterized protein YecE (DUF72 family)
VIRNEAKLLVGTSGWAYKHWRGPFYPPRLPSQNSLTHYAKHFLSVEINSTFYRLPSESAVTAWHDTVPIGFVFSVKASRHVTHFKKLTEPQLTVPPLLERVSLLGDKLGPILFQLPPRWGRNVDRLARFLDSLSSHYRYAFEFRDHSWFDSQVLDLLADHGAALCVYDLEGFRSPDTVTTDFAYVRLHGPGAAYSGCYSRDSLERWGKSIADWLSKSINVYCYFDNDESGYAPMNALSLQSLVALQDETK